MYSDSSPSGSLRRKRSDGSMPGATGILSSAQSPTKVSVGLGLRPSASASSIYSPSRHRRTRTTSGSRSESPLTLTMDGMQGMASAYNNMSHAYAMEAMAASPVHSSSTRSPFQSPAHSRSSSMTSMKSILRERSGSDRSGSDSLSTHSLGRDHKSPHAHGTPHGLPPHPASRQNMMVRDRSLDRQIDRHLQYRDPLDGYATYGGGRNTNRERSLDRSYPYMGSQSLERGHAQQLSNLVRSQSIDHEYMLHHASSFSPSSSDLRISRDSMLLDLQAQLADLNKECASLQHELDSSKEKLSSSMNSIKTFWSPELKKERAMRKEESGKLNTYIEQLKVSKAHNQTLANRLQGLEDEVSALRQSRTDASGSDVEQIRRDRDRQSKEVRILRKTVEEMELRIETQKQTLTARDGSINKLLEMLKSRGASVAAFEADRVAQDELRACALTAEKRVMALEAMLEQRDDEITSLKQQVAAASSSTTSSVKQNGDVSGIGTWDYGKQHEECNMQMLEAMVDSKDSRIQSLEKEVKLLEDELLRVREEGTLSGDSKRLSGGSTVLQLESLKSQEKLLKAKIENLRTEVSKKDSELYGVRTQMETLQTQRADKDHHIAVLREAVSAKEQQARMLQADVDSLRDRLKEKDETIEQRSKAISAVQAERKQIESDILELQDHLDIKERKIGVLQRKLDGSEDLLREKEGQLSLLRSKITSYQTENSSSDSALSSLEDSISDKERTIEKLKAARDRADAEHQEELEHQHAALRDQKLKLDRLGTQVNTAQTEALQLREELQELRNEKFRSESQVSQLQMDLSTKAAELAHLQERLTKLEAEKVEEIKKASSAESDRLKTLENEVKEKEEQRDKIQGEVDRLLGILKDTENEKHEKDKLIKDLQEQLKEYKTKMGTLKRSQNTEKKKNAQMLEEARKRETNVSEDATQLKSELASKKERVEELEMALKESVSITAEREMVLAEEQHRLAQTTEQLEALQKQLLSATTESAELKNRVNTLNKELEISNAKVKTLQAERNKHLADAYEMKQEAILAAITEKDAHIALLEMAPNKNSQNIEEVGKLTQDKIGLQRQLKDLTQSRMKLINTDPLAELNSDSKLVEKLKNSPPEQVDKEDGIWT